MRRKTTQFRFLWFAIAFTVFLCVCSCSSNSPETTRSGQQTGGGSVVAKPIESPEPSGSSVSSSSVKEGQEASDQGKVSRNGLQVKKARLQFTTVNGMDTLKVVAEGSDKGGNKVSLRYEWTKNGQPAGEGDTLSGFKRGDKLSVRITPFDDQRTGTVSTVSTEIHNTPPRITEHQLTNFDGKVWTYQVKAVDADGDPLTYELKQAPQGMVIDRSTGLITWKLDKDTTGRFPVSVQVSDGHGGESVYDFEVAIGPEKPRK
ncbi:MAG TPA: putative Ig domain-containing protein [Thermodesulfovibrionales bacterium]|nr:putative Ig domain-containing protein [Thermodesulfovibrionales bacterium]